MKRKRVKKSVSAVDFKKEINKVINKAIDRALIETAKKLFKEICKNKGVKNFNVCTIDQRVASGWMKLIAAAVSVGSCRCHRKQAIKKRGKICHP